MPSPRSLPEPRNEEPATTHLVAQKIDENGPGTILRDFETLLNFVDGGVKSTGKYHLLPMSRLLELDQQMSQPMPPQLKRPQQRAFPYVNALYLLLRATQLAIPDGYGKRTGRLILNPVMYEQWLRLNPTERYFTLLEACLDHATLGTAGPEHFERPGEFGGNAYSVPMIIPPEGLKESDNDRRFLALVSEHSFQATMTFLGMFGLISIEWGEPLQDTSWRITSIGHTPFGDELLPIVTRNDPRRHIIHSLQEPNEFGAWQDELQPYFPEWVNNLIIPPAELREGIYYFKVSLGNTWRRIAIPGDFEVDALAWAIIDAYKFDGDHLYCFYLNAKDGRSIVVGRPEMDDADEYTDDMAIGELPLNVKQSVTFEYDFGAEWRFEVTLEKIEPDDPSMSEPSVVESHGKAPREYECPD